MLNKKNLKRKRKKNYKFMNDYVLSLMRYLQSNRKK